MEEMLNKFYKEYADRYAKFVDASDTLDVAVKHPELFDESMRLNYQILTTKHFAEVRELRRIAKILGVSYDKLDDIEDEVIKNL